MNALDDPCADEGGSPISPVEIALFSSASVLLLCLLAGLWRAVRGPTTRDRLTAFVLLGTTGVALLAVLGSATGVPAFRDAALTVVALATVVVVVLLRRGSR